MAAPARDKYYLRTVHEEIGLFDRKIAHSKKYDTFASDSERVAAVAKLITKREALIKTAKALIDEGIEFRSSDLPRSLRPNEDDAMTSPVAEPQIAEKVPVMQAQTRSVPSIHDGSALNFRNEVQAYMQKRRKAYAVGA